MVTLEQRLEQAAKLHAGGYNCSQCVMLSFRDLFFDKLSAESAAAVGCALGGGVCGSGHICGAASAMGIVTSLLRYASPADKRAVYSEGRDLIRQFADTEGGKTECRELKGLCGKPCSELIADAVTILHKHLEEQH